MEQNLKSRCSCRYFAFSRIKRSLSFLTSNGTVRYYSLYGNSPLHLNPSNKKNEKTNRNDRNETKHAPIEFLIICVSKFIAVSFPSASFLLYLPPSTAQHLHFNCPSQGDTILYNTIQSQSWFIGQRLLEAQTQQLAIIQILHTTHRHDHFVSKQSKANKSSSWHRGVFYRFCCSHCWGFQSL